MQWITGNNASGKTLFVKKILDRYTAAGKSVITNIGDTNYSGYNASRIRALKRMEDYYLITYYGEIEISGNSLVIETDEPNVKFTQEFFNILTLLCRKGDYLIIDEPAFGLYSAEINSLVRILLELVPTYKGGVISTVCQSLYCIEPENFYLCENYKLRKISEDELYESIPQFWEK